MGSASVLSQIWWLRLPTVFSLLPLHRLVLTRSYYRSGWRANLVWFFLVEVNLRSNHVRCRPYRRLNFTISYSRVLFDWKDKLFEYRFIFRLSTSYSRIFILRNISPASDIRHFLHNGNRMSTVRSQTRGWLTVHGDAVTSWARLAFTLDVKWLIENISVSKFIHLLIVTLISLVFLQANLLVFLSYSSVGIHNFSHFLYALLRGSMTTYSIILICLEVALFFRVHLKGTIVVLYRCLLTLT